VVTPILYFIDPGALSVPAASAFLLVVGGLANITGVILYLYAMHTDEVSVVAPLFQLSPLFSLTLGYFFLGETLTRYQMLGFATVFIGAVLVSLDLEHRVPRLKWKPFVFMVLATMLLSINGAIFKYVALEEAFWPSMFWEYFALIIAGIILLGGVKRYRRQFFDAFKKDKWPIISFNVLNEITGAVGYLLISYASLLVPIAIVSVISGTQPLFLFLFGALFTLFFPKIATEDLSRKVIVQKLSSAVVIFIGGYLLNKGL
jgi:drug/metabolite transporter (DMT)-like permease